MTREKEKKIFTDILDNLEKIIHGKTETLRKALVCFFAGGHILLEDVPGVGKTTLAKALATSLEASFQRVQFTPDLLPADITGITIYKPQSGEFTFRPGPVFSDILLADEINRSSPRTQSALLEAMSEWQVTVEGKSMPLGKMFTVIATQNPVEYRGTYPLPEAQLDRFFMRLVLGYPERADEMTMLKQQQRQHPLEALRSVVKRENILQARKQVKAIKVNERACSYLLDLVEKSRIDPRIRLGISPRGSLALYRVSQALAWSQCRDYVLPDDLQYIAVAVLAHRVVIETKDRHSGLTGEEVIKEILEDVPLPA